MAPSSAERPVASGLAASRLRPGRGGRRPRRRVAELGLAAAATTRPLAAERSCACAAGSAPLLPWAAPPPPRRRVNGGLGGGCGGLGGGGFGGLGGFWQPRLGRGPGGRREAPRRLFSLGGLCVRVLARGGRWRGAGAFGALRRVSRAPATRAGASAAALPALGLQCLPRPRHTGRSE